MHASRNRKRSQPARRKSKPKKPPQSSAIVHVRPAPERTWELNRDEVELVKNTICKGATDVELQLCLTVARRYRLDPFKKQIWFVPRWDKNAVNADGGKGAMVWTTTVGIDGLTFAAARDHREEYGNIDLPEYGPLNNLKQPEWAKVQVWKKGATHPTRAIAYWDEYAPYDLDKAPFWRKMPRRMLGKCATALAIRQAYPDLGGLYIPEEMDRIGEDFTPGGRRIVQPMDGDDHLTVHPTRQLDETAA